MSNASPEAQRRTFFAELLERCYSLAQQYPWLWHIAVYSPDSAIQRLFVTPFYALSEEDKARRTAILSSGLRSMGVDQLQLATQDGIPMHLKINGCELLRCGHLAAIVDRGPLPTESVVERARGEFFDLSSSFAKTSRDESWSSCIQEPTRNPRPKTDGSTDWYRMLYEMTRVTVTELNVPRPDSTVERPIGDWLTIAQLPESAFVASARLFGAMAKVSVPWVNGVFPREITEGQSAICPITVRTDRENVEQDVRSPTGGLHVQVENSVGQSEKSDMPQSEPSTTTRSNKRKRGRPKGSIDSDCDNDRRLHEAWNTGEHKSIADLARSFQMDVDDAKLAMDRHRKRLAAAEKTRTENRGQEQ